MYPPAQPVKEILWLENPYGDEEVEQPLLSVNQYRGLEYQTKDNILDQFISTSTSVYFSRSFSKFNFFLREDFQDHFDPVNISTLVVLFVDDKMEAFIVPIEIGLGKSLIINAILSQDQQG